MVSQHSTHTQSLSPCGQRVRIMHWSLGSRCLSQDEHVPSTVTHRGVGFMLRGRGR